MADPNDTATEKLPVITGLVHGWVTSTDNACAGWQSTGAGTQARVGRADKHDAFLDTGSEGAVSGAGDVNGDGLDDLLVGDPWFELPTLPGRSYVVFGVPTADNCCSGHTRGGCTNTVFEACVCDLDAACCDDGWNASCVNVATDECGACG